MGATERALEAIKDNLESGEAYVDYVVATRVEKGNSGAERGALAVTSKRLIYQGSALFGVGTRIEWRFSQLNGVAATKSMMFEHIELNSGGATIKFLVTYGEARPFVAVINQAMSDSQNEPSKPPPSEKPDIAASLTKLADLFSKGLLTEEEFADAKRKLIT